MQTNTGAFPLFMPTAQDLLAAWQSVLTRSGLPDHPGNLRVPEAEQGRLPGSFSLNPSVPHLEDKQWSTRGVNRGQTLPPSTFQHYVTHHWASQAPGQLKVGQSCREPLPLMPSSAPQLRSQGISPELLPFFMLLHSLQSFGVPNSNSNGSALPPVRNNVLGNLAFTVPSVGRPNLPCQRIHEASPSLPLCPSYQTPSDDVIQNNQDILSGLSNSKQIEAYEALIQHLYNQTMVKQNFGLDADKTVSHKPMHRNERQGISIKPEVGGQSQNAVSHPVSMPVGSCPVAVRQNTPVIFDLPDVGYRSSNHGCWSSVTPRQCQKSHLERETTRVNAGLVNSPRQVSGQRVLLSTGEVAPIEKLNIVDFVNSAVSREPHRNTARLQPVKGKDSDRLVKEMCWGKLNQIRMIPGGSSSIFRLTFSMPSRRHRLPVGCAERNRQQNMASILWPQFGIKSFKINKKLGVDIPAGQPLYVHGSGWSSLEPFTTWSHLQLRARQLTVDDICLVLVQSRVEEGLVRPRILEQSEVIGSGGPLPEVQQPLTVQTPSVEQLPLLSHEGDRAERNICQSPEVTQTDYRSSPANGLQSVAGIKISDDGCDIPAKRSRNQLSQDAWVKGSNSPTGLNPTERRENKDKGFLQQSTVAAKWQAFSASHLAQSSYDH